MTSRRLHGSTLLELLLAISLAAICLLIVLPAVKSALLLERSLTARDHADSRLLQVRETIEHSLRQSHSLFGVAAVGSCLGPHECPYLETISRSFPAHNSSAVLAFLRIDPRQLLTVMAKTATTTQRYTLCGSAVEIISPDTKFWLLFDVDGISAVRGGVRQTSSSPNCPGRSWEGEFSFDSSAAFFRRESPGSPRARLLIPLDDSVAFYLDRQHTLRRFSLIKRINQPVLRDVRGFALRQEKELYRLTIAVGEKKLTTEILFAPQQNERGTWLNLVS